MIAILQAALCLAAIVFAAVVLCATFGAVLAAEWDRGEFE